MAKLTRPMVRIHDLETNKVIDREMNDEEFAAYEIELQLQSEQKIKLQAEATAKAAVLAQLGITEEQAKLLLS